MVDPLGKSRTAPGSHFLGKPVPLESTIFLGHPDYTSERDLILCSSELRRLTRVKPCPHVEAWVGGWSTPTEYFSGPVSTRTSFLPDLVGRRCVIRHESGNFPVFSPGSRGSRVRGLFYTLSGTSPVTSNDLVPSSDSSNLVVALLF